MPLTMRGLASTGYYKDHADYLIFCGGWNIGRIYEIRSELVSSKKDKPRQRGCPHEYE
jgi:hypothetical protein